MNNPSTHTHRHIHKNTNYKKQPRPTHMNFAEHLINSTNPWKVKQKETHPWFVYLSKDQNTSRGGLIKALILCSRHFSPSAGFVHRVSDYFSVWAPISSHILVSSISLPRSSIPGIRPRLCPTSPHRMIAFTGDVIEICTQKIELRLGANGCMSIFGMAEQIRVAEVADDGLVCIY